jgi:NAD(P)H-nitrite reductase large subunit
MKPDDKLCYCFHVTQRKIVNFIRIHQPRVPSEISECGGAGTGCGWCVPFLRKLYDAAQTNKEAVIEITPEEYAKERSEYVAQGRGKPPGP